MHIHFQSGLMILAMYSLMISGGKVQNIAIKAEASPAVVSMNVNTDQIKREASKWISSIIQGWIFCQIFKFLIKKKITNLGDTFKNKIKLRYCFHNFSDSEGKYHNEWLIYHFNF